jgi:hypothetical protein
MQQGNGVVKQHEVEMYRGILKPASSHLKEAVDIRRLVSVVVEQR